MPTTLRIYPGIGIARLGQSRDEVFLAPEVPGLGPLELTADDSLVPIAGVRAQDGLLRRQGARFRIFEIETDDNGVLIGSREISSAQATIEWKVELANQKAASGRFAGESMPEAAQKRNPGIPDDQLVIRPVFSSIAGPNRVVQATTPGRFKGTDVYLGELRTDALGRLIVLGGLGVSDSVPPNQPIGDEPNPSQNNFANNRHWYDDISDGPVSATVTFAGAAPVDVNDAWVIVAPPDFAPGTRGLATLYDVAYQAAVSNQWLSVPQPPSYKSDILPILKAVSEYRFVSDFAFWEAFGRDWAALGKVANTALREATRNDMIQIEDFLVAHFKFTSAQSDMLDSWVAGNFIEDFDAAEAVDAVTPDGLDRASLEQGVGGGFFPGIEAGIMCTYRELYAAPFRIRRDPFQHGARQYLPSAGFMTRNMACPWQADFWECSFQGPDSIWWPAQRPLEILVRDNGNLVRRNWDRGVSSHRELVQHVMELGFLAPDGAGGEPMEGERRLP